MLSPLEGGKFKFKLSFKLASGLKLAIFVASTAL